MADQTKLLYLISQFPAINHGYLLAEVRLLRSLGLEVSVVSISLPDRPLEKLSQDEREEVARTYYVKSVPASLVAFLNIGEFLWHPLRYLRGLIFALGLAGSSPERVAYHLAYFAEAILVGRRMRQLSISHVHASFSAGVALITACAFPVTMSFGVYGFGELYDPSAARLTERIKGALFVRSISRHERGQLMLACDRSEWSKLVYVPLGIDAAKFASRTKQTISSPPRLLSVGRLAPEKGQALLLEAVAVLQAESCPVQLCIVGDGPDRPWLERLAAELGIASNVEFAGWVDQTQLMTLYAKANLFVLPSLAEGIPIVLMEAMAMQIPCVAPHITGVPELIEHGVEGMLFAVGDVEDLKKVIRNLLESPELCLRIGMRGRARIVRDYDIARNTERFGAVLVERLRDKPFL
ncbi:MAG TPA: glycosyltransferase family 4 protein [Candidatus Acidoferrales bacterium]|nr:glycosyltransferase family 4 protein [Candidatus Acidoferrales bacterium]